MPARRVQDRARSTSNREPRCAGSARSKKGFCGITWSTPTARCATRSISRFSPKNGRAYASDSRSTADARSTHQPPRLRRPAGRRCAWRGGVGARAPAGGASGAAPGSLPAPCRDSSTGPDDGGRGGDHRSRAAHQARARPATHVRASGRCAAAGARHHAVLFHRSGLGPLGAPLPDGDPLSRGDGVHLPRIRRGAGAGALPSAGGSTDLAGRREPVQA